MGHDSTFRSAATVKISAVNMNEIKRWRKERERERETTLSPPPLTASSISLHPIVRVYVEVSTCGLRSASLARFPLRLSGFGCVQT